MREISAGDKLDRYELRELVARSGVASIFRAVDADTGATVAVKIPSLQLESDMELFERLRREEEIGQRLEHPNIVKVLAPGHKSQMYVVMEYVAGETLREVLQRERKLSAERTLVIARQLCEALVYLHGHGIVHRNLKPENVVLTQSGQVKVLGLGFALDRSARRLTWTGLSSMLGQLEYLAPEQVAGGRGDSRSDIYACGTLLYEMLCGEVPFPRRNAYSVDPAKTFQDPRAPSQLEPGIEPGLESIILKCIQRSPRDRYETALELLRDLRDPAGAASRAPADGQRGRLRLAMSLVFAAVVGALVLLILLT
ncbi:MAG: serine/threonine-protein kinase [Myxococcales bacterium]